MTTENFKVKIVGILNVSPESFSGDGVIDRAELLSKALQMAADGADCIDVGAQSTKPRAPQLSLTEEKGRLTGLVGAIKERLPQIEVSVDTTRKEIAEMCITEGATMINDISGGRFDSGMIDLIKAPARDGEARSKIKFVLTHSQGNFSDLHDKYEYENIVEEIISYFKKEIARLIQEGIEQDQIILDPGIGFSKSGFQNFEIISQLEKFTSLNCPIYVGLSRKKFIGTAIGIDDPSGRDNGTSILQAICIQKGASYIRTHNVLYAKQCLRLLSAVTEIKN